MEFNTLVLCMQQLTRLTPRIRSLRIANCYSSFISKTTVPVQNTAMMHHFPHQPGMHLLYTRITSFTLPRRREEYHKLGFTLHQDFSRALVALMEQSQGSIRCLEIQDNFLDLEMTELIFCIVRYGRCLEHLLYDGNRDGGFVAPEVVSAITAACPQIRSFRGQHAISDTVLRRMMTGWEDFRSVTLAPYQSPTLGIKEVSLEGFWSLLECGKVESLELLDLDCISNENIREMVQRVKQLKLLSMSALCPSAPTDLNNIPDHPFAHHASLTNITEGQPQSTSLLLSLSAVSRPLPGDSVRHLALTKYTSSPLTLPGFGALLKLFPNLETLKFTTNFFTYEHQFQGLTKDIYEKEIAMIGHMILSEMTDRWSAEGAASCWIHDWYAPVTEEQRLRAGIMHSQ
ncbi:hypothetical protein BX616_006344 [Lobosporangium transversale]|nr:hypothetical protein BX616_006344 [Lobosporangium transversale]